MGFCPQFNVLYDMLTVSQHIMFYGQLKGLTWEQAEKELMNMLQATGMMEKKDAQVKSLSGMCQVVNHYYLALCLSGCFLVSPKARISPY